jgi:DNA-binding NarL/FixJ family response regulator
LRGSFAELAEGTAEQLKRDSSASRVRVCLLWKHPVVLVEVQRALSDGSFELLPVRIEPSSLSSLGGRLPQETVLHVIEGDAHDPPTDAIVTQVLTANPSARSIVLAEEFTELAAFSLLRLGAKGLITYAEASQRLPRILGEVDAGGFWVPRALLSRFVDETRAASAPRRPLGRTSALTPREQEILDDLLHNLSNKEIASKRRISSRTAKFHVSNVLSKHGVRRRADLFLLSFPERGASQPT